MDFWTNHGWWFLLGCIFWPRLVIAIVGMYYWNTNPFLCICALVMAFVPPYIKINGDFK